MDWTPQIHPEGQLYFSKDVDNSRRYLTLAYLRDKVALHEISQLYEFVENSIRNETRDLPEKFEVVLELMSDLDAWGYYMVDHTSRCIFWLQDFDVLWAVGEELEGIQRVSQMSEYVHFAVNYGALILF